MNQIHYRFMLLAFLLFISLQPLRVNCSYDRPNIILILTDDQDHELGSLDCMPKLKKYIGDEGLTFTNMFVTTPICCPSRSSIVSGTYVHNHGAKNNTISGGCSGPHWLDNVEPLAFPIYLKKAGYNTFYAGKYLNQYGFKKARGPSHVPPGWDWWSGLIGPSYYYNYPMSVNGTKIHHGSNITDYLTNVIKRTGLEFLEHKGNHGPFFMMMSFTAPHTPSTPIPPYTHAFANRSAPRTPHFNRYGADKHWLLRSMPKKLPENVIKVIDELFRNRWRSLQSIDDVIETVYKKLEEKSILNNTVIIYTSDNGYHLGQFCIPLDKRQLYEFDIRVPLMVRGPIIKNPGRRLPQPILNIDLAPTILGIAGVSVPKQMEGRSILPLLRQEGHHKMPWRKSFLVEYWGQGRPKQEGSCAYKGPGVDGCVEDCICIDAWNNTYSCVRTIDLVSTDEIYCEIKDTEHFTEYYNIRRDPYQLENTVMKLSKLKKYRLRKLLNEFKNCKGKECRRL